ncbi:hypothetical protein K505DRAFT_320594 [Melanomma pulvis-pyrius CBS 109.77]|uniref:Uncharacterized protein n=1 Tax=Melanomma pulvis-pyrius CBS 109.77 TaxID=1314802 RepID=A0A6A6XX12_9PLEO|nr:hypothetical protein K505DRAFT_320594 [Melanomma pulvis-pyrius CBS 109.77]
MHGGRDARDTAASLALPLLLLLATTNGVAGRGPRRRDRPKGARLTLLSQAPSAHSRS